MRGPGISWSRPLLPLLVNRVMSGYEIDDDDDDEGEKTHLKGGGGLHSPEDSQALEVSASLGVEVLQRVGFTVVDPLVQACLVIRQHQFGISYIDHTRIL